MCIIDVCVIVVYDLYFSIVFDVNLLLSLCVCWIVWLVCVSVVSVVSVVIGDVCVSVDVCCEGIFVDV